MLCPRGHTGPRHAGAKHTLPAPDRCCGAAGAGAGAGRLLRTWDGAGAESSPQSEVPPGGWAAPDREATVVLVGTP